MCTDAVNQLGNFRLNHRFEAVLYVKYVRMQYIYRQISDRIFICVYLALHTIASWSIAVAHKRARSIQVCRDDGKIEI